MSKRSLLNRLLPVLGLILVLTANGLANALPLNGLTTGEISDRFEVLFVPAGYVFSIWGLIYLGLTVYTVYQLLPGQRSDQRLHAISLPFLISSLANSAWIFLWHYEYFSATLLAMITLLVTLIVIYQRLDIGREKAGPSETWLTRVPFQIYLGWVSVATIANVTSVLDYLNWGGWGLSDPTWAVIMLAVAVLLAGFVGWTRKDLAYLAVFVWALAGIAVEQSQQPLVAKVSWAGAGLTAAFLLLAAVGKLRPQDI
jgi:hypothetical protein